MVRIISLLATSFILCHGHGSSLPLMSNTTNLSIAELVAESPLLTVLQSTLRVTGLDTALDDCDNSMSPSYTLFAPINKAFIKLRQNTTIGLLADRDLLTDILKYHVIEDEIKYRDMRDGSEFATLEGSNMTLRRERLKVTINESWDDDGALVVFPNIMACNGVIHLIKSVLVAPDDLDELNDLN